MMYLYKLLVRQRFSGAIPIMWGPSSPVSWIQPSPVSLATNLWHNWGGRSKVSCWWWPKEHHKYRHYLLCCLMMLLLYFRHRYCLDSLLHCCYCCCCFYCYGCCYWWKLWHLFEGNSASFSVAGTLRVVRFMGVPTGCSCFANNTVFCGIKSNVTKNSKLPNSFGFFLLVTLVGWLHVVGAFLHRNTALALRTHSEFVVVVVVVAAVVVFIICAGVIVINCGLLLIEAPRGSSLCWRGERIFHFAC